MFIAESLETDHHVNTITTDFGKAFDTVSHYFLISKLDSMGVGNPLLSWYKSYVIERKNLFSSRAPFLNCLK